MHLIENYTLVSARNIDSKEIKDVIYSILNEYGLKEDEDKTDSDLNNIQKYYTDNNGFFGKILQNHKIVGTVGLFK